MDLAPLTQHQIEIERNLRSWQSKPLLQKIYAGFYERISKLIDRNLPGTIVEIGSGIGNLKATIPEAVATDLFPNPWLDLVCDGYELPFATEALSHLILFDVFHHLQWPGAFLHEAARVLNSHGRLILFEPFISFASYPVYGMGHHEPVAWHEAIDAHTKAPSRRGYYAAQGNATRIFFEDELRDLLEAWELFHRQGFAAFSYLLSGGFSKPALYSEARLGTLEKLDAACSRWPKLFGARCLVGLRKAGR